MLLKMLVRTRGLMLPSLVFQRSIFVQVVTLGVVIAILALFAIGIVNRGAKPVQAGAAPQFTIPLYGGGDFSLADERGKVVVINFWASWCVPCRDEASMLERVWKKYKRIGPIDEATLVAKLDELLKK